MSEEKETPTAEEARAGLEIALRVLAQAKREVEETLPQWIAFNNGIFPKRLGCMYRWAAMCRLMEIRDGKRPTDSTEPLLRLSDVQTFSLTAEGEEGS